MATQETEIIPEPAEPERKAGYLITRLRPGEGVIIDSNIEVRIAIKNQAEITLLAIRAPKNLQIRKVK
jgi:hypothetical protein